MGIKDNWDAVFIVLVVVVAGVVLEHLRRIASLIGLLRVFIEILG